MDRGDALAQAFEIGDRILRRYQEPMRSELLGPVSEGAAEAVRKWDTTKQFRPWATRIILWRIQDYWRRIDPLTRRQRELYMICKHCGEDPESELTQRRLQVWEEFASGKSYADIAKALDISLPTVRVHITHLKAILGIRGSSAQSAVLLTRKWLERQSSSPSLPIPTSPVS